MRIYLGKARCVTAAVFAVVAVLLGGCGGDSGPPLSHTLGSGSLVAPRDDGRSLGRSLGTRSLGSARSPGKRVPARFVDVPPPADEAEVRSTEQPSMPPHDTEPDSAEDGD